MVLVKQLTSPSDVDAGGATQPGAVDWHKLADYFNDVNVTESPSINNATSFRNDLLRLWSPAKTFTDQFNGSAIVANRNITIPLIAADGNFVFDSFGNIFSAAQRMDNYVDLKAIAEPATPAAGYCRYF